MERNDIYKYDILSQVESAPRLTNRMLTAKLGCSIKLTHQLLSELIHKGFIHVRKHNYRHWDYMLTPKGVSEKARLAMDFLDFSFKFYYEARKESSHLCRDISESGGGDKVAFLGSGQLAEICFLGVKEWSLDLVEVYDKEPGGNFLGIKVLPIDELGASKASSIIVCLYDKSFPMSAGYLPEGIVRDPRMRWIFTSRQPGGRTANCNA